MKETTLTQAINSVIDQKLEAVDRIVRELIEPINDVGSPEKLIGKKYDAWLPDDLQMLTKIYGTGDKTPLSDLIFRKTLERVKELEREELSNA